MSGAAETIRVGLIADTHGWLDPNIAAAFAGVSLILHAGDIGHPRVIEQLEAIAPTTAVKGNIDGGELRFLPLEVEVPIGDRRVAILHIAGNPKRPNRDARALLGRLQPDVLLVGHSHIPVVGKVGRTLWINPGAAGRHGFHTERLAAILKITPGQELALDRVHLGPRAIAKLGVPDE